MWKIVKDYVEKLRQAVALISIIMITLLFLDFTGTAHAWLGWMTRIQFLPALLSLNVAVIISLVLLTLLLGRVYCSVICPLGIMQDGFAWLGKNPAATATPIPPPSRHCATPCLPCSSEPL